MPLFIAFISSITNKRYTATQYAILSSIATWDVISFQDSPGVLVKDLGWVNFYFFCALIAVPGLLMLLKLRRYETPKEASTT
ncbi:MAG: hypothetical protein IPM97_00010 [Bdellovibrionaceae bacterium]|nr:hypothetical protein [Pseudobdellovibrionaceae bacterium]